VADWSSCRTDPVQFLFYLFKVEEASFDGSEVD
jgi:hypothetical protein